VRVYSLAVVVGCSFGMPTQSGSCSEIVLLLYNSAAPRGENLAEVYSYLLPTLWFNEGAQLLRDPHQLPLGDSSTILSPLIPMETF